MNETHFKHKWQKLQIGRDNIEQTNDLQNLENKICQ